MDINAQGSHQRGLESEQVAPGVGLRHQATVKQLVVQPGLYVGRQSEVVEGWRAEGYTSLRRRLRF